MKAGSSRRWRRRLLALVAGASVLVSGWWVVPTFTSAQTPSPPVGIHKLEGASFRPEAGDLLFIAVIGTDARQGLPGRGGRCDAVHIVAVNPRARAGTILNIPRDAYLEGRKLTDVCGAGGVEPAVGILSRHTGFPIQYYATTEFSHFMRLIDELGGLEIEVPYRMNDPASGAFFEPGPQWMGGGPVLAFSRNRKDAPRGDFGRTANHGVVMLAALRKFRAEMQDPHRLLEYLRIVRRNVHTTVPLPELIKLGLIANEIDPANVQNVTIPGSTGTAGTASVVFLSPGDIYQRVRDDGIY